MIKSWISRYSSLLSRFARGEDLLLLLIRLTLGVLFTQSGWGKLQNIERVIEYFQQLGIPGAAIQAPFVAGVELICGTALLFGLFSAIFAAPLVCIMVVAMLTARRDDIDSIKALTEVTEFLYLLLLFMVIVRGSGKWSVGYWLGRKRSASAK